MKIKPSVSRKTKTSPPRKGSLRVWWIPQIPMHPFYVEVANVGQGMLILTTLADYDKFQLKNRLKPDYANTGGLERFTGSRWEEWQDIAGREVWEMMEESHA